jgi:hypothetical protein
MSYYQSQTASNVYASNKPSNKIAPAPMAPSSMYVGQVGHAHGGTLNNQQTAMYSASPSASTNKNAAQPASQGRPAGLSPAEMIALRFTKMSPEKMAEYEARAATAGGRDATVSKSSKAADSKDGNPQAYAYASTSPSYAHGHGASSTASNKENAAPSIFARGTAFTPAHFSAHDPYGARGKKN